VTQITTYKDYKGPVFVVGLAGVQQAGAAPRLDGAGVDVEAFSDLVEGEQSLGAEPLGVAGQVMVAA
jgi:hypothetical protein